MKIAVIGGTGLIGSQVVKILNASGHEAVLLLSAIAARWHLRLADGARVRPVVSSTLVPSELPIVVTSRWL